MMAALVLLLMVAPPPVDAEHTEAEVIEALTVLKGVKADVARDVAAVSVAAAAHADVDALFLVAVAYTESRLTLKANGDGGRSHGPWQMCMAAARTVWPELSKHHLYEWVSAAHIAAMYWARLRTKYGKRSDVVYNCGPVRCKGLKSTVVTRAYWRRYKALIRRLER
jgi:hypothetical protein